MPVIVLPLSIACRACMAAFQPHARRRTTSPIILSPDGWLAGSSRRRTHTQGRIFMTHPTKAIYYSLLKDLAKTSKNSTEEQLYNEEDLDASMQLIEVVDFYATIEVAGMKASKSSMPVLVNFMSHCLYAGVGAGHREPVRCIWRRGGGGRGIQAACPSTRPRPKQRSPLSKLTPVPPLPPVHVCVCR